MIDVDVNTALERISQNRDSKVKLFEKKEFLQKVRENYLRLRQKNLYIINGNPGVKDVFVDIKNLFFKLFN